MKNYVRAYRRKISETIDILADRARLAALVALVVEHVENIGRPKIVKTIATAVKKPDDVSESGPASSGSDSDSSDLPLLDEKPTTHDENPPTLNEKPPTLDESPKSAPSKPDISTAVLNNLLNKVPKWKPKNFREWRRETNKHDCSLAIETAAC